jgi:hypothetical protein
MPRDLKINLGKAFNRMGKMILCREGEDPFASGLCFSFATFDELKKRKRRYGDK